MLAGYPLVLSVHFDSGNVLFAQLILVLSRTGGLGDESDDGDGEDEMTQKFGPSRLPAKLGWE